MAEEKFMTSKSERDREKTKLRERQRRSITTKIFNGLRQHGGYKLPARADINDVLRALAAEAGWLVEPDGRTYRAKVSQPPSATSNPTQHCCTACGSVVGGGSATPTTSLGGGVGGGDCSTTTSPRNMAIQQLSGSSSDLGLGSITTISHHGPPPLALLPADEARAYLGFGGAYLNGLDVGFYGRIRGPLLDHHQQQYIFQEARASNQNTPMGSPQHDV